MRFELIRHPPDGALLLTYGYEGGDKNLKIKIHTQSFFMRKPNFSKDLGIEKKK